MPRRPRQPPPPAKRRVPAPRPALYAPPPPLWKRCLLFFIPPVGEMASRWSALAWAMLSVVLLRLVHPPFSLWPLAFVALAPWLWGLRKTTPRAAFWISWVFGTIHFVSVYWWLGSLSRFNPFIWAGIPLLGVYMGLYYAVQGGLMVWAARKTSPWTALLFSALLFGALEWFRSVGKLGVPFALLSQGVRDATALAQVNSLGGGYLLSALLFWMNVCAMEAAAMIRLRAVDPGAVIRLGAGVALVVGGFVWGAGVLSAIDARADEAVPMRIALVQPNVPQEDKFAAYASPDPMEQQRLSTRMAASLLDQLDGLEPRAHDLIVTPESAFPSIDFDENHELHREIAERAVLLGAPILAGAADLVYFNEEGDFTDDPREARLVHVLADGSATLADDPAAVGAYPDYTVANGAFLFLPDPDVLRGKEADYRKVHLMPFGETIPYFGVIPGLAEKIIQIGEFAAGDSDQPPIFINVDPAPDDPTNDSVPVRIAPTICFEDMAPYLHRRESRRGAQLFVNLTNNAWFDDGIGSRIHFEYARMRCPETRIPMVLATNTGVTAYVDAAGRVVERLPPREQGVLSVTVPVPAESPTTLYARLGDWFGWLAFLGSIACIVVIARRREDEPLPVGRDEHLS